MCVGRPVERAGHVTAKCATELQNRTYDRGWLCSFVADVVESKREREREREVYHDTNKKPASLASHTPPSSGPSPCLAFCCSPTSTAAIAVSNKNGETLARRHALAHQPVYCDHRDDTTTVSPPNSTIRRRRPVGLDHLVLPSIRRVGTSVAAGSTTTAAEHCGPRGAFLGGRQSRTRDPMDVRL